MNSSRVRVAIDEGMMAVAQMQHAAYLNSVPAHDSAAATVSSQQPAALLWSFPLLSLLLAKASAAHAWPPAATIAPPTTYSALPTTHTKHTANKATKQQSKIALAFCEETAQSYLYYISPTLEVAWN